MRRRTLIILGALLCVGIALGAIVAIGRSHSPEGTPAAYFGSGVLEVRSPKDKVAEVTVEVATSGVARAQGLQGRASLLPGHGMAFVFPETREGSFVMKDTMIPLRIAFWDEEGVVRAVLDMEPCLEDPCPEYDPEVPYIGALEASPATFEEAHIAPGATVDLVTKDP